MHGISTTPPPLPATRLVPAAWSVKVRRTLSRHCKGTRVYDLNTTATDDNEVLHAPSPTPSPPASRPSPPPKQASTNLTLLEERSSKAQQQVEETAEVNTDHNRNYTAADARYAAANLRPEQLRSHHEGVEAEAKSPCRRW